ncbi:nucleophile aminohydrolase [Polychytrium aggregatum]|uniref:nucleophile aminohydrolase n=1 Tax=Polychytrium aggregatum TaxID=110093 RepID=UPI0022FE4D99|nr:nucleophile aminohydrolase [Polychytrium aggregatum]KAI9209869.1 nucleophile aminohydrolase [Polychytrium aggregatum]
MQAMEYATNCPVKAPVEHRFSPYTDNGGTTLGIAGEDFVVLAGDTRNSEGYSINTRFSPKVHALSNQSVLAIGGMQADSIALLKRLGQQLEWYRHQHDKSMSVSALAQLLQVILYGKRFFPYYTWNILGGIDAEGKGALYDYDPVGNYERVNCACVGSASELIQPFLDSQVDFKNQVNATKRFLAIEEVIRLVKDAFTSATERDIHTGDFLQIVIVRKDGIETQIHDLKRD